MYGCQITGSRHNGWYVTDPEGKVHGAFGTKESAKRWIRASYAWVSDFHGTKAGA